MDQKLHAPHEDLANQTGFMNSKLEAIRKGVANQYPKLDAIHDGLASQAGLVNGKLEAIREGVANQYPKLDAIHDGLASQAGLVNGKLEMIQEGLLYQYAKLDTVKEDLTERTNFISCKLETAFERLDTLCCKFEAVEEIAAKPSGPGRSKGFETKIFAPGLGRLRTNGWERRHIEHHFQQFFEAFQNQNYGIAIEMFVDALELNPEIAYRYFVTRASFAVALALKTTGRTTQVVQYLDALLSEFPNMHLLADDDLEGIRRLVDLRRANMEKGLPSIVLVTQQKSASVAVGNIFTSGFNLPSFAYSLVDQVVIESWARDYARGGACYVTHLTPTPANVACLKWSGLGRMIVHVRDPRQTLVSRIHHIARYPEQVPQLAKGSFEEWEIAEQVDELLESYTDSIAWIQGWLEAENELHILFSTFKDFSCDRTGFIDRYIEFYGSDLRQHFSYENAVTMHEGTDYHFRSGLIDEWRDVFPANISRKLTELLPTRMKERFCWQD